MPHDVISTCPVCSGELAVTRLHCRSCGTTLEGDFSVGRFGRLSREQLALLESFLRSRGNLREMERELGLSYPTVRSRVEALVRALGFGPRADADDASGRRHRIRPTPPRTRRTSSRPVSSSSSDLPATRSAPRTRPTRSGRWGGTHDDRRERQHLRARDRFRWTVPRPPDERLHHDPRRRRRDRPRPRAVRKVDPGRLPGRGRRGDPVAHGSRPRRDRPRRLRDRPALLARPRGRGAARRPDLRSNRPAPTSTARAWPAGQGSARRPATSICATSAATSRSTPCPGR